MKKTILFVASFAILFSCSAPKDKVKLSDLAKVAEVYNTKIQEFESKIDPTNIETFMQMGDSISMQKKLADSSLTQLYLSSTDTLFLPFKQTMNLGRIEVLSVWVVGAKYNELFIEASVRALDNSSIQGPYTSLSVFDKEGANVGAGGGIGGPVDTKLQAGELYIFTGKIDKLHLLQSVKTVVFDEDIKKW